MYVSTEPTCYDISNDRRQKADGKNDEGNEPPDLVLSQVTEGYHGRNKMNQQGREHGPEEYRVPNDW